eukprot:323943-Pyramimonas_sp.AAC.2
MPTPSTLDWTVAGAAGVAVARRRSNGGRVHVHQHAYRRHSVGCALTRLCLRLRTHYILCATHVSPLGVHPLRPLSSEPTMDTYTHPAYQTPFATLESGSSWDP